MICERLLVTHSRCLLAYPPFWFKGRLVSLQDRWKELNSPQVSDQMTLVF